MDKLKAVEKMQEYIKEHVGEDDFTPEQVCDAAGYSRRHADRMFKEYLGKTIQEYINAVCLTAGAEELLRAKKAVVDIALESHFQSHEGFTRSFRKRFGITPSEYRDQKTAIPLFIQYPVSHYHILQNHQEVPMSKENLNLCMITAQEREKRKLIYLPSRKAKDYLSYCEEMGCEWEGLLNSIPEKMDTAALLELPDFMVEEGFSKVAAGIEVPADYDKELPKQYRVAELPECTMLYFQSEPYEKPEDFGKAIESVYAASGKYEPAVYGYQFAYEKAPAFNFGADSSIGARIAIPALRIK